MNTMLKELFEEVERPEVTKKLVLVPNTGANRDLPTGCRYCELKEEMSWTHLSY